MFMTAAAAIEDDDDKAFMLNLYNNYFALVRKTTYSIVRDSKNVEDLINDTFIKLIEKVPILRTLDCCKTASYVVYTTRSVAINFIKHRDVQNKHIYYGGDTDLSEDLPGLEDTIDDRLIYKEDIESLSHAIMKLPEKQKDLLYFKYILRMNDSEIAENFGINPDSVRQYLTRARREAKKLMEKEMSNNAE